MIDPEARPRLASKAKLRHDRKSGQDVLLYPEKGLVLNATGSAIVRLCTGELSLSEIYAKLAEQFPNVGSEQLREQVNAFVETLASRGLIEGLA